MRHYCWQIGAKARWEPFLKYFTITNPPVSISVAAILRIPSVICLDIVASLEAPDSNITMYIRLDPSIASSPVSSKCSWTTRFRPATEPRDSLCRWSKIQLQGVSSWSLPDSTLRPLRIPRTRTRLANDPVLKPHICALEHMVRSPDRAGRIQIGRAHV